MPTSHPTATCKFGFAGFDTKITLFVQLVLDCWNTGDWGGIRGYPVKFAIGLVSVFFDLIFLFQVGTCRGIVVLPSIVTHIRCPCVVQYIV